MKHSCLSNDGNTYADPGVRIKEWVNAFGANGSFESACDDSFGPALTRIAQALAGRLANTACLANGVAFLDPGTCRLPDCTVVDHSLTFEGSRVDVSVPDCARNPNQLPCWELVAGSASCVTGQRFNVRRAAGGPIPDSSTLTCRRCAPGAACPVFN